MDIVQVSSSCSTKPFGPRSHWRLWVRTHSAPEKAPSSFSSQSNSLLPSSINFFPLSKYASTSWHNYSCSYMVTWIGELIRVENNSAKEEVIFNPAEFPSPVLGAVVVPWGGRSTGPTESGSGEGRGRSCHCCWAASVLSHTAVTAESTCSSCRKCIR